MSRIIETYRAAWRSAKTTSGVRGLYTQAVLVMFAVIPVVVVAGVAVLVGTAVSRPFSAAAFMFAVAAFWPIALGTLYAFLLLLLAMARTFVEALRPPARQRVAGK